MLEGSEETGERYLGYGRPQSQKGLMKMRLKEANGGCFAHRGDLLRCEICL